MGLLEKAKGYHKENIENQDEIIVDSTSQIDDNFEIVYEDELDQKDLNEDTNIQNDNNEKLENEIDFDEEIENEISSIEDKIDEQLDVEVNDSDSIVDDSEMYDETITETISDNNKVEIENLGDDDLKIIDEVIDDTNNEEIDNYSLDNELQENEVTIEPVVEPESEIENLKNEDLNIIEDDNFQAKELESSDSQNSELKDSTDLEINTEKSKNISNKDKYKYNSNEAYGSDNNETNLNENVFEESDELNMDYDSGLDEILEDIDTDPEEKSQNKSELDDMDTFQSDSDYEELNLQEENNITKSVEVVDSIDNNTYVSDEEKEKIYDDEKDKSLPAVSEGIIPVDLKEEEKEKRVDKPESHSRINKDIVALYEISKEIMKSKSRKQLFDVILFTAMGQIGASSAAILFPDKEDQTRWKLDLSRGINLKSKNMTFKKEDPILDSLIERKVIVDIDEFKENIKARDEYIKFISIETKLLCPVVFNDEVLFALTLGDKITIGDYSFEEKQFIRNICEISGVVSDNLSELEDLRSINSDLNYNENILEEIDKYEEIIRSSVSDHEIASTLDVEYDKLGISSYAVFVKDESAGNYRLRYNERADFISFRENDFRIGENNAFTAFLLNNRDLTEIENPVNSDILKSIFSEEHLLKINIFAVYPFIVKSNLAGFVLFLRSDIEKFKKNRIQMRRFSNRMFSYLFSVRGLYTQHSKIVDNFQHQVRRFQRTIEDSQNLNIPVGFALFSIKNLKRYLEVFGENQTFETMLDIKNTFEERLSDTDYLVRISTNKFLLVMPGKNKKAAITMCNSLKNEMFNLSRNDDTPLLITYIVMIIPDDALSIYDILNEFD